MLRLLKYLILFILGYKVIKELFKTPKQNTTVPPSPKNPSIHTYNNGTTSTENKFGDAEVIDFEEVK